MQYRTTPHSITGVTPAELMFNRQLRTKLDLLYPTISGRPVRTKDVLREDRIFDDGDYVFVRNFSKSNNVKWLPGKILQRRGEVMYKVLLEDSNIEVRRHVNQIKRRVMERIPELENTMREEVQTPQCVSLPNIGTTPQQRYPSRNHRPPERFRDQNWT